MDELNAVDGRAIVEELMNHSPMKVVTPYGVVFRTEMNRKCSMMVIISQDIIGNQMSRR